MFWQYLVLAAVALYVLSNRSKRSGKELPFPPGPKGLPVIGNLLDNPGPDQHPHIVYESWAKKYGDIMHINVLGQHMIILSSLKRAHDLFDKKSSIYSDRIRLPMLNELMGYDFNVALMRYSERWRRYRSRFHEHFHVNMVHNYQPVQERESRALLRRLLSTPEDFFTHIRETFAAIIMDVSYGIKVSGGQDPYVETAEGALQTLAIAGIPGSFLVDVLPVLKYVPAWFPGAGFQRKAEEWKKLAVGMSEQPYEAVKSALAKGTAQPSAVASMISKIESADLTPEQREEEHRVSKGAAAASYIGGSDTTVSTVQSFFMAMAANPEVLKKAQAEIDSVVGNQRLPTFSDRAQLPYIDAIAKETLRWQPVLPLSVAHAATEDDVYDGYRIPKGAIVMGNSWAMLHDPEVYPEPLKFNPDRFMKDGKLNPEVRDPDTAAFGFGRRICPGRWFSDNSVFILIASICAVYDISAPVDADGKPMPIVPEMTSGLLIFPKPFKCVIKPRSPNALKLIEETGI